MPTSIAKYAPTLFISGPALNKGSGGVALSITAPSVPGHSGFFRALPLVMSGLNQVAAPLALSLAGAARGSGTGQIPLSVQGATNPIARVLPLLLYNNRSGLNNSIPLLTLGAGSGAGPGTPGLPGGTAYSKNLSLVVCYGPSAALPLFLRGVGAPMSGGVPLSMTSRGTPTGILQLVMPSTKGVLTAAQKFNVTGF